MIPRDNEILALIGNNDMNETIQRLLKEKNRRTLSYALAILAVNKAFNADPESSYSRKIKFLGDDNKQEYRTASVDDDGDIRYEKNKSGTIGKAEICLDDFSAHEKMRIEEVVAKIREVFCDD
tara:strand:+ start:7957 stop:8325 length:369 start_codon:yes stop_codon:yes gene_type:complete